MHDKTIVRADPRLYRIMSAFIMLKTKDILLAREAMTQLEFDTIRRVAHDLKGEGTAYGFPDLSEMGAALEGSQLWEYFGVACRPKPLSMKGF